MKTLELKERPRKIIARLAERVHSQMRNLNFNLEVAKRQNPRLRKELWEMMGGSSYHMIKEIVLWK